MLATGLDRAQTPLVARPDAEPMLIRDVACGGLLLLAAIAARTSRNPATQG
jgi:hypothetical protein